jgi:hypothetical protein
MKAKILFIILIIGLLTAGISGCRILNNTSTSEVDIKEKKSRIPIAGCWVSENYFNSIKYFKSPKKAQGNSLLIIIPQWTNEKATIMYDFHDDFDYFTIVENQNMYEIWEKHVNLKTNLYSIIEVISSTKIKIGEFVLIKINPIIVKDYFHQGLKSEILIQEELLFKGNYLTSEGKEVEFKNNGQLKGLDGFYFYAPNNDYYDEGMQVDKMILVKSKKDFGWKDLEFYGFKFNTDTLEIYKLNCIVYDSTSQNCAEVEFGELKYRLERK